MELAGRGVLVTGGARRIGAAIVRALAAAGARVAIHCHASAAEARSLAASCTGAAVVEADLADPASRARLLDAASDRVGPIAVLVNNASTFDRVSVDAIDERDWHRAIEVNLTAPFFLARDAGVRMRAMGGGLVVNLTDWAIDRPYAEYLPYYAAKAGLRAMTRGLARALAPQVRVNAIAPGPILLPDGAPADYEDRVVRATPLHRLGGPDAIVAGVMFLVGDDYVTGETIVIDGGRSLR